MFTGIVETEGLVHSLSTEGSNLVLEISSEISNLLAVDQSVSHNGVCLTVTRVGNNRHEVVAIEETLSRSNLGRINAGTSINLERAMQIGERIDGHLVQGHVDACLECTAVRDQDGSHVITIAYQPEYAPWLIPKGSICLNGVSLTIAKLEGDTFDVAIIPYTWEHTNLRNCNPGTLLNVEFDMVGKYLYRFYRLNQGE